MSDERATLVGLSMEDPAASVRDPAFQALLRDGWTVAAHLPAERGGRQEWVFLMTPPRPSSAASGPWWRSQAVLLWTLVVLQALTLLTLLTGVPLWTA